MDARVSDEKQDRIEALIADMTLSEKLGQLSMLAASLVVTGPVLPGDPVDLVRQGRVGGILNTWGHDEIRAAQQVALSETRLGIPLYFSVDVLHGHRTIYPIPLAEACAFDRDLWRRTAAESADEATRDGIHMTFAPMLDVCRDPRWGRISECAGEDGFVNAEYARAKVQGYQSANDDPARRMLAVAKHFVAYGAVTAGRDYAEVDISQRALHEIYLPPFKAAVEEGVAGMMPSFTDVAGIAMSANRPLLHDLLRVQWGFGGVVVSDYNAIAELINHGVANDLVDAAVLALKAGIDIDMMSGAYEQGLPVALERGLVSMDEIDMAVRRVLRMKADLGLFDDPYRGLDRQSPGPDAMPHHRASARDAARRSLVLVKNDGDLLPMAPNLRRIALIGPLADAQSEMMGPWCMAGDDRESTSFLQGMREACVEGEVRHALGCKADDLIDADEVARAVALARDSEIVFLCLGEERQHCGEAASRTLPRAPACQLELARAVLETGKPVVLVLATSRPWILPDWMADQAQAILIAMFGGNEAGRAFADVVTGAYNPSGRLCVSWPVRVGQIPIHYGMRRTGRPHDPNNGFSTNFLDAPIHPRFAFGQGLSYTQFELNNLRCDKSSLGSNDSVTIEIEVTNSGARDGAATLFLFINDPVALVTRPMLELKDFAKINLKAGETRMVTFTLASHQLCYPGYDLEPRLDDGRVDVIVGSSARIRECLVTSIEVVQ